ncbi:MAG: hypothetical protein NTY35_03715 [Planctomycetota bacterium]|nr:hypothetical protein [Planctomycetota bacterium]
MSGGTAVFLQNREFFGAMIVHVPLLFALRRLAEGTPLVVYSPFERGRLFESIGLADETRVWTRKKRAIGASEDASHTGLPALIGELRSRRFHRVLSLRPQSADIIAATASSGAAERIGYRTLLSRFALTSSVPRDTTVYRAVNYLNLLGELDPSAMFVESMAHLARNAHGAAAVAPGAYCLMPCGSEPPKLWGESNFIALARAIVERDPSARFLLVIGEGERRYVELFAREGLGSRTSALVGGSLPEIARAVLDARVVVANDCGPSHVAQIAGAPIVSIFGNWDGRARVRIAEWFHPRPGARCVTTAAPAPVQTLGVEPVLAEVGRLLEEPRARGGTVEVPARVAAMP